MLTNPGHFPFSRKLVSHPLNTIRLLFECQSLMVRSLGGCCGSSRVHLTREQLEVEKLNKIIEITMKDRQLMEKGGEE